MTSGQSKVSAVVLALVTMLGKQYLVHGSLDPAALLEWVIGNWDILFGGLMIGWAFLRSRWLGVTPHAGESPAGS